MKLFRRSASIHEPVMKLLKRSASIHEPIVKLFTMDAVNGNKVGLVLYVIAHLQGKGKPIFACTLSHRHAHKN